MGYIKGKRVYAILMSDSDGQKIVEQASELPQEELDRKIDEFFNAYSNASDDKSVENLRTQKGGEEYKVKLSEEENEGHKSSITHPEDFDGDIDFNETADLYTNYENGEVDYLSNTYLSRIYDLYNGNENAMIDHLRQFDTGVSNGDMQGIVEAFVINKKRR